MRRRVVLLMGLLLLLPTGAQAVTTITVGNWNLVPGLAGQFAEAVLGVPNAGAPIALIGVGADSVDGMDFRNYINGGVVGGPFIDGIDFGGAAGGIEGAPTAVLSASHLFPQPGMFLGLALSPDGTSFTGDSGLTTAGGMLSLAGPKVSGSAPYSSYSFSTVGVAPGVYSWSLTHATLGVTTYLTGFGTVPVSTILIDGTITVVPEPGSIVLCLFGVAGIAVVAIRRKRGRRAA